MQETDKPIREELAKSPNMAEQRRKQLAALMPEVFSEGKLDIDALKRTLGESAISEDKTPYALNWPGKETAYKVLQNPSSATLRPQREQSVDFEQAQHVFIEGENLEVLKVLQKAYFGKIKLIYIDPPYNTGSDSFIYPDRYSESKEDYLKRLDALDDDGFLMREGAFRKNNRENGHYHSNWLSMMLPRLYIARDLLREDGVIFVSIDDNEVHNLRHLMDEIFGEENFVCARVWQKGNRVSSFIGVSHEYMLVYARDKKVLQEKGVWRKPKEGIDEVIKKYKQLREIYGNNHKQIEENMQKWYVGLAKNNPCKTHAHYKYSDDRGLYFAADFAAPEDKRGVRPRYDIIHPITGQPCKVPSMGWRWKEANTKRALEVNPPLIHFGEDHTTIPCRKSYLHIISNETLQSVFYKDGRAATLDVENLIGKDIFDFPKDTDVLQEIITTVLYPKKDFSSFVGDGVEPPHLDAVLDNNKEVGVRKLNDFPIVMDFFAGSASMAHAVLAACNAGYPCNFIVVQLPEPCDKSSTAYQAGFTNIATISRERIRRVIDKLKTPPMI